MIGPVLALIKSELQNYLVSKAAVDTNMDVDEVVIDNIAKFDLTTNDPNDWVNNVVISLVNVEEESTLKNNAFKKRNPISASIDYIDPSVHVNLYLLFTSLPASGVNGYEKSLTRLSYLIQFFQHRKRFEKLEVIDGDEYKTQLIFELYTLTFEQINHLWGSLGGKQVPFVMYKARLVKIQENITTPAELIEEIELDVMHKET